MLKYVPGNILNVFFVLKKSVFVHMSCMVCMHNFNILNIQNSKLTSGISECDFTEGAEENIWINKK